MSFNKRHLHGSQVDPAAALSPLRSRRFVRDYFGIQPNCCDDAGYGDPTGSSGDTNLMFTPNGAYEYNIKGTATALAPSWDAASGLNIGFDKANDEGVEITAGIGALSAGSFTIGTVRAFYAKTKLEITDVSGTDEFLFGFRKNAAYQQSTGSYNDYAALGIVASAATAAVVIKTRINSGTAGTIDTTATWADEASHTLEVQVNDEGYARFYIDEGPPAVTKTNFVFDSGDVVNWFLFWLFYSAGQDNVYVKYFEYGYLPRRAE